MKILMLSLDGSILRLNSASADRIKEYGTICDELHIIVLGKGGKKIALADNVFVYPTSKKRIIALIVSFFLGKKILYRENGWIITCQDPFEAGFISWLLSRKSKAGLEIQLHGDFYGNNYWRKERALNRLRWHLGKFVIKRATAIRVVSQRIGDSIKTFTKAKIFKNPIYSAIKDRNLKTDKNDNFYFTILSVGNLVPVKNHKQLIESFAEIKNELPKGAKLIIAGDGPLKKDLKFLISDLRLEDDVFLLGHQEELENYYKKADIFVHPSLYEGWGRAIIEAGHFALPIIMSNVGLAEEIIKNRESGIVVPVNNKEALKQSIIYLAKDEQLREKLGQSAKKAVMTACSTKQDYLAKIKESWQANLV